MLDALMDGRQHRAGELARRAGVAASTASEHLARLLDGGLVLCDSRGRERHYRLASTDVAEAVEALARLAPELRVDSLRSADRSAALRRARTCYDHLAGELGVAVTEALVGTRALAVEDGAFRLTSLGDQALRRLSVDVDGARGARRSFARSCLDWSERRPHLAGSLGAAVAAALLDARWLERRPSDRGLIVTPAGASALRRELGLAL